MLSIWGLSRAINYFSFSFQFQIRIAFYFLGSFDKTRCVLAEEYVNAQFSFNFIWHFLTPRKKKHTELILLWALDLREENCSRCRQHQYLLKPSRRYGKTFFTTQFFESKTEFIGCVRVVILDPCSWYSPNPRPGLQSYKGRPSAGHST